MIPFRLGASAAAISQIFTLPISVITTRQQTIPLRDRKSFIVIIQEIIREEGILGIIVSLSTIR